jgi:hypothetical protein
MTDTKKPGASIVSLAPSNRPEPPDEPTAEQGVEWRKIVASSAPDRFGPAVEALLVQYVRHVCNARHIAVLSNAAAAADLSDDAAFDHYDLVRKMAARESKAITRLARALCLGRRLKT